MKHFFLVLAILLLTRFVEATDTVMTGTQTVIGTQTEGTTTPTPPPAPYITSVQLLPAEVSIVAGGIVTFTTTVQWSDKQIRTVIPQYSSNANNGIFTGTKTGTYIVTVTIEGQQATARVTILPGDITQIKMVITQPKIFYGMIYDKTLFSFIGLDNYGNEVKLDKVDYKFTKQIASHLSTWIGESPILVLNEVIKAGVIFNDHLLFFDVGTYSVMLTVNDKIQTTFSFPVVFQGYENVVAWGDYRIVNIDFDKGTYIVGYTFTGIPEIQSHFIVKDEWVKQFKEGDMTARIQVLCWIHYQILLERARLLKDIEYEQFKNLLLKPLQEKF